MTLTSNTMEWLNQNRRRSYPLVRDEWRSKVSASSRPMLDCVLLDALVFDADAIGEENLILDRVKVEQDHTTVFMTYGSSQFKISLSGGEESGERSYECWRGIIRGSGIVGASVSLSFSSHAYVISAIGVGDWELGCAVIPSRVVRLSDGTGVEYVSTNGSIRVDGHEDPVDVDGDVVLEDGYRTSPIVFDGDVLVRVGTRYGCDPCKYDYAEAGVVDCRMPLFFFCGQNGINSGNVNMTGGRGVSVTQGGTYTVEDKDSKCDGLTIPCIEIVATRELLDISGPVS